MTVAEGLKRMEAYVKEWEISWDCGEFDYVEVSGWSNDKWRVAMEKNQTVVASVDVDGVIG